MALRSDRDFEFDNPIVSKFCQSGVKQTRLQI